MVRGAVVISARNISRHVSVLLLAGLWALSLVWLPTTTRLSEDRVVTSLGQVEGARSHPLAETRHLGTTENDPEDGELELPSASLIVHRDAHELDRPSAERATAPHRHDFVRSARGPPTRA
jgi:hypothetical protein